MIIFKGQAVLAPAAVEYRLTVATDPELSNVVLNVLTSVPRYQTTVKLANSTYYWQTASRTSGSGWQRLADIPHAVSDGGALAYCGRFFGTSSDILVAFIGGGDTLSYAYVDQSLLEN
jgi:hypothetical protein